MGRECCKISEKWKTFDEFLQALNSQSFEAEFGEATKAQIDSIWDQLSCPISIKSKTTDDQKHISYADNKSDPDNYVNRDWGMLIVDKDNSYAEDKPWLRVHNPDAAIDFILQNIAAPFWSGSSAACPDGVKAETGVVIGPKCEFGDNVILESNVRIGTRVKIGANVRIGANSKIDDDCTIGANTVIGSNTVIGGNGFGLLSYPGQKILRQRLHIGAVTIGENVRIGSNVSVDRGVFDDTFIGDYVNIDNIVQIGHNCVVGRASIICGYAGLAGSSTLGEGVVISGMVGVGGHLTIHDGAIVTAGSGVSKDVKAGAVVKGIPAQSLRKHQLQLAALRKLPDMLRSVGQLMKGQDNDLK